MRRDLVRYSKFLSLVLRHDPSAGQLTLDGEGWADVSSVLKAAETHGFPAPQPKGTEILVSVGQPPAPR